MPKTTLEIITLIIVILFVAYLNRDYLKNSFTKQSDEGVEKEAEFEANEDDILKKQTKPTKTVKKAKPQNKTMNIEVPMNLAIKLTKKQRVDFSDSLGRMPYKTKEDIVDYYKEEYKFILNETYYPKNPNPNNYTNEEDLINLNVMHTRRDFLFLSCYEAYTTNNPQIILDGFYTNNHLFSAQRLEHQDSVGYKELLECYSGNNIKLAEYYLDNFNGEHGPQYKYWNVTIKVIRAIRTNNLADDALASVEKYLSHKHGSFDEALVLALKAILIKDIDQISNNLSKLVSFHSRARFLHDFNRSANKYIPYIAYSVYSIAFFYLDRSLFEKIVPPTHNLWWKKFAELNIKNNFKEGKHVVEFTNELSFLKKIIY